MISVIYLATLETRHYSFQCVGTFSTDDTRTMLIKGLEEHAKEMNLHPDWWKAYDDAINVHVLINGSTQRDGQTINPRSKA